MASVLYLLITGLSVTILTTVTETNAIHPLKDTNGCFLHEKYKELCTNHHKFNEVFRYNHCKAECIADDFLTGICDSEKHSCCCSNVNLPSGTGNQGKHSRSSSISSSSSRSSSSSSSRSSSRHSGHRLSLKGLSRTPSQQSRSSSIMTEDSDDDDSSISPRSSMSSGHSIGRNSFAETDHNFFAYSPPVNSRQKGHDDESVAPSRKSMAESVLTDFSDDDSEPPSPASRRHSSSSSIHSVDSDDTLVGSPGKDGKGTHPRHSIVSVSRSSSDASSSHSSKGSKKPKRWLHLQEFKELKCREIAQICTGKQAPTALLRERYECSQISNGCTAKEIPAKNRNCRDHYCCCPQ